MKLGARPHMDLTLGSRTQAMELGRGRWSPEVLEAAGVDPAKMPELVPSGTAVGRIKPGLADALGIPPDALLVAGGHDQPCAALGVGAVGVGLAADGMGSVECIVPVFDKPLVNEVMRGSGFACAPHVLPGLYVTYAFNLSAGALLKWYRNTIEPGVGYASLIQNMAEDAQGLMLLPHFAGAATPHMDPLARGGAVRAYTAARPAAPYARAAGGHHLRDDAEPGAPGAGGVFDRTARGDGWAVPLRAAPADEGRYVGAAH